MANKNKILIIVSVLNKLPQQLEYIQGSGVMVHNAKTMEAIQEEIKKDYEYIILQNDIYDMVRYKNYVYDSIKGLGLRSKVFQFFEKQEGIHWIFPLFEMQREEGLPKGLLLDFIQNETNRPIAGAKTPFVKQDKKAVPA